MQTARLNEDPRFWLVSEVADYLRVSKITVYRMIEAGTIPAIKVGHNFRIKEEDLHAYLRSL